MQVLSIYSLFAVLQASAWAVTVAPRCNADNCLRGLFGVNAKSVTANMAACSTGLPTVTVSVDGTSRAVMTGTAAPPAAATVCDGQGVAKRAARFQSACSCVGILPSTVTVVASTTTSAAAPQITLGQVATSDTAFICSFGNAEIVQFSRDSPGPSYVVPTDGQIVSASTFSFAAGTMTFEVWRPSTEAPLEYLLIGKGEPTTLVENGGIVPLALPQPISVQAGDLIGLFASGGTSCGANSPGDVLAGKLVPSSSSTGEAQLFATFPNYLLNVAAVLQ